MGMTIDDNVDFLNEAKDFYEDVANDPKIKESVKIYFIIESLETAVDTMRKYKKIEQILEDWTKTEELEWKIREVLEDGNDIL